MQLCGVEVQHLTDDPLGDSRLLIEDSLRFREDALVAAPWPSAVACPASLSTLQPDPDPFPFVVPTERAEGFDAELHERPLR